MTERKSARGAAKCNAQIHISELKIPTDVNFVQMTHTRAGVQIGLSEGQQEKAPFQFAPVWNLIQITARRINHLKQFSKNIISEIDHSSETQLADDDVF
jgi:hypothetical protein